MNREPARGGALPDPDHAVRQEKERENAAVWIGKKVGKAKRGTQAMRHAGVRAGRKIGKETSIEAY